MLWPTLGLAFLLAVFFLEARVLGGRTTLSGAHYLTAFGIGCVLVTVVEIIVERALQSHWDAATFSYTVGPTVEQLAEATPLLVLAFGTRLGRRLAVVDFALVGFATGLGAEFVEENLRVLATGSLSTGLTQVFPLLPGVRSGVNGQVVDAGHPIWTGLVGLAVGLGVRLWPRDLRRFLPALVALAWVIVDHGIYNWQIAVEAPEGGAALAEPIRLFGAISGLTAHGRLEIVVLGLGLVAANWLETRWCWDTVGQPSLLLDQERQPPLVAGEWWIALRRIGAGAQPLRQLLGYMRRRHAYLVAEASRDEMRPDPELDRWLRRSRMRLARERRQVDDANVVVTGWAPPAGWWRRPGTIAAVAYIGVMLVLFGVALPSQPGSITTTIYSAPLALMLATSGLAYALWQANTLRREPAHDLSRAGGAELAARRLRTVLVWAAVGSGALAVLGWFLPTLLLAGSTGGVAHQSGARNHWAGRGGNPDSLLGAGAGAPPRKVKDRCRDQQRWVDEGLRRLKAKQAEIDWYTRLRDQTAARGARTGVDVGSDVYTLNLFIRTATWEKGLIEKGQRQRERWLAQCKARPPHAPIGDPPPPDIEVGGWTPPGPHTRRHSHNQAGHPQKRRHQSRRTTPNPVVVDGLRKPRWWPWSGTPASPQPARPTTTAPAGGTAPSSPVWKRPATAAPAVPSSPLHLSAITHRFQPAPRGGAGVRPGAYVAPAAPRYVWQPPSNSGAGAGGTPQVWRPPAHELSPAWADVPAPSAFAPPTPDAPPPPGALPPEAEPDDSTDEATHHEGEVR